MSKEGEVVSTIMHRCTKCGLQTKYKDMILKHIKNHDLKQMTVSALKQLLERDGCQLTVSDKYDMCSGQSSLGINCLSP